MSSNKSEGTIWSPELKAQYESKRPGEYMDPCQDAASKSMKCLYRNAGDREMCTDYFQSYRDCKKQWVSQDTNSRYFKIPGYPTISLPLRL